MGIGYQQLRWLHIMAVLVSGGLFLVRAVAVQAGAQWAMTAPLRYLSYGIDTVLLAAALLLFVMLPAPVFANGWLAVKLVLVVAYIVSGSIALKRGRTPGMKRWGLVAALVLYASIFVIAWAHDPLAPVCAVASILPLAPDACR